MNSTRNFILNESVGVTKISRFEKEKVRGLSAEPSAGTGNFGLAFNDRSGGKSVICPKAFFISVVKLPYMNLPFPKTSTISYPSFDVKKTLLLLSPNQSFCVNLDKSALG